MFVSGRYDWNLWLWWVVLTTAGYTAAMVVAALAYVVFGISELATGPDAAALPLQLAIAPVYAVTGAIAGFAQWLALRTTLPRAGWWILATGLGWMTGYLSTILLPTPAFGSAAIALAPWLAIGLATGFAQWVWLRSYYQGAGSWVVVTVIAIMIGAAGWISGSICGGTIAWAAGGALTGFVLIRKLATPI